MISAGHPWPEVRKYTLRQLTAFYLLAKRRENDMWLDFASITRACHWADDRDFKQLKKGLRDGR